MIVADASAVVQACLSRARLDRIARLDPCAPPLLWSEFTSAIHELAWRRQVSKELASQARARFATLPIRLRRPNHLYEEAGRIADRIGWAKTYDAEYVALAILLRARVLTVDMGLKTAAGGLVEVVGPADIGLV